ncbi:HNH endonuclease [Bacillus toyonensis]|uniref:HNH endonuclease n=1 Tax=Bacillus toyonensis TaxID=155322 RepID=UPI000BFBF74C|nr:HNH endonuclease signature motif containing protein [Bacillus toyonensis]PHB82455.1 HNH endonuclease [Bacillus toyonensis]
MLLKICRCGKTILMEQGMCEACSVIAEEKRKQRHRDYKVKRMDIDSQKFYNSKAWRVTRARIKDRDNGLCQLCWNDSKVKPMNTVHHIIPLEENDRLSLVRSNLISLCEKCHQKVHKLYDISTEKYVVQKMLRSLIG